MNGTFRFFAPFLQNGKFAGSIDPFAAGMAEDHVPGSDLGILFHTILVEQFERLRDGDRFKKCDDGPYRTNLLALISISCWPALTSNGVRMPCSTK